MMTTKTTDTAVEIAAQIQALQQQIETVEDSIGAAAVGWRQAAADPAASLRAAERIGLLERQRDMLQTAKGEAEQALATYKHDTNAERVEAAIGQAQQQVEAAMAQRVELGQELAAAVDRVARECVGVRVDFQQGIAARRSALQVPA